MATQTFDGVTYKAAQRQDWSTASAGWKKWRMIIEQGFTPVTQRMVELAQVRTGQRVLDVTTGIGEPALTAARLVGPSGHVTATDIAPGMLEIATERAKQAGLSNIEFREMDAESIDFPEGSFDAVLCRFGLMFLPNLAASLKAIRRVLATGGHLAAAVWGPPERHFGTVTMGAVARELQLPPPQPGTPNIFSLADRKALERSLAQAGLTDVRTEPLNVTGEFDSGGCLHPYAPGHLPADLEPSRHPERGAQSEGLASGGGGQPAVRGRRRHPAARGRKRTGCRTETGGLKATAVLVSQR
jgi:SAM-dependent methyltransferase